MSKLTKNMELVLDQGSDMIEFYRANPCIAAYDLLGVDFAPIQRIVFEDLWFKPYAVVVGGRGFGKSSYIGEMTFFNDKGLVYLYEELPPIPNYLKDGEEEIIDLDRHVLTSIGFRPTKSLCLEKNIKGKKVITQNGLIKRGSNHHPLLTLREDGCYEYKKLSDFCEGDRVCIKRGQMVFGKNSISEDDAYIIGLLIGDGNYNNSSTQTISTADEDVVAFCVRYCVRLGINYSIRSDKRSDCLCVFRFLNNFRYFFEKFGISRSLSYDKSVPYSIRTSTKSSQKAFLQGYYDTNGTADGRTGGVSCCSVSKKLIREIQLLLLNFGVVARLREKKTNSPFGKAYLLDATSQDALKFKELIGFGLSRKQKVLDLYFSNKKLNVNKDTIPYALLICKNITNKYRSKFRTSHKPSFNIKTNNKKELTYDRLHQFLVRACEVEKAGFSLSDSRQELYILKDILYHNYYFDTVTSVGDWEGDCYDFEMDMGSDVEPNYYTNGFINHNTYISGVLATLLSLLWPGYRVGLVSNSFRQAKLIFAEVEKMYNNSSIMREATLKPPVHGSDSYSLKFRPVGGSNGSFIEALPLGSDGGKIRGSRFYCILIDEFAQLPQKIIETVLTPMTITALNPMVKVRELEKRKRLVASGLAVKEDFEKDTINKIIGTSSGFYKFNHMYKRMRQYWNQIAEGSVDHAVYQIPYTLLPEGFLDPKSVENAYRTMSDHEFRMEYMADMVSDSEGFFKASVLESCTLGSGFEIEMVGDKSAEYIIGMDPNQGGRAKCGVVVVKLGSNFNKIVRVLALDGKTMQDLTSAIQDLCETYNVIRVYMDRGGGGKGICDLLQEGYNNKTPLLDRGDLENLKKEGKHILEMIVFSSSWIQEANYAALSLVEGSQIKFPERSVSNINDLIDAEYDKIDELKKQCVSIVVTQTSGSFLHFDTPKKDQNKDLYSALILAAYGIKAIGYESTQPEVSPLYTAGGMIRLRDGSEWKLLNNLNTTSHDVLSSAVLKKQ